MGGTKPLNGEKTAAVEKKILVVDDDRHCRDGLRDSLLGAGYSVETAADSREAIEKVKARLFEVAIIDLDLPPVLGIATSGWELVRIFRDINPAITVIVVGAEEDKQVKARAAQLKVSEFLEKPISPARLKTIVRTL
jgi:CheY-like chemotaxis protein